MNMLKTFAAFAASSAMAVAALVFAPGTASADETPTARPDYGTTRAMHGSSGSGIDFQLFQFGVGSAEENTSATITLHSCGRDVATRRAEGSGSFVVGFVFGTSSYLEYYDPADPMLFGDVLTEPISNLGPTVTADYTFHVVGKTDRTYANAVRYDNLPYDCGADTGAPPAPGLVVKSWSKKAKRDVKVGKTVSLTATKVGTGTQVRYAWKAGSKTVKRGPSRSLRIKKACKGKVIKVSVQASKGSSIKSKTITFGKVS